MAHDIDTVLTRISEGDSRSIEHEAKRLGFMSGEEYLLSLHYSHIRQSGLQSKENLSVEVSTSNDQPVVEQRTERGKIYRGDSSILMHRVLDPSSVDLIMTSPPFGLVREKEYGNQRDEEYLEWFQKFAEGFRRVLKEDGSLVIDIGGAWREGKPTRSLYHFELLVMLCKEYGFHLAQEFYWWNPSKLPTPAEWVNVRRIRVKDAVNCVWWLSKTEFPKASNRRVLQPYSKSMKDLIQNGYRPKLRPSGHDISDKFQRDNGGAIPPNLIAIANTESNSRYARYCRERNLKQHPARFPAGLPAFFIRMLTNKNDLVLDPFGGSCVTGEVAEAMDRNWVCCELDPQYVEGAKGRFLGGVNPTLFRDLSGQQPTAYSIYSPSAILPQSEQELLVEDGGRRRPGKRG